MRKTIGLIALVGYGEAGKDVLGAALVNVGFKRLAFGDHIKRIFDPLCQELLGYSAFTPHGEQKEHIRPLLVHGGQTFYHHVSTQFFGELDDCLSRGQAVVNTRLFRIEEAREWAARGGLIWEVCRSGYGPKEPEEARSLRELHAADLIDNVVFNDGDLPAWETKCAYLARIWKPA